MSFNCSSVIFCGSLLPMNGIRFQPVVPSYADVPVMPWIVKSTRMSEGRALTIVIGASMGPIFIFPVRRIDLMAVSFSLPPIAFMFFSSSSSAVWPNADTVSSAAAQRDSSSFFDMNPPDCGGTFCRFLHTYDGRRRLRSEDGDEVAHSGADVFRLGDESIALGGVEERAKGAIGVAA